MGGFWKALKERVFRFVGIANIRPDPVSSAEPDEVYRAYLRDLEMRRQKLLVDLEHLGSRHEYFLAVVKAGPYAIMSSLAAVGLAVLTKDWNATFVLLTVVSVMVVLVVVCNRHANIAEITIGRKKLDSIVVEERYRVKNEEVRSAIVHTKSKAQQLFEGPLQFSFSFDHLGIEQYRKSLRAMLPYSTVYIYEDMRHRHPRSLDIILRIHRTSIRYADAIEDWRTNADQKVKALLDNGGRPNWSQGQEQVDELSRRLLFCLSESLLKKGQVGALEKQGRLHPSVSESLMPLFGLPLVSLLVDPVLRPKAIEIEGLRKKGAELLQELNNEAAILYSKG